LGHMFVLQTSHEGSWCQASIAGLRGQPSGSFLTLRSTAPDVAPVELWATPLASSKRSGKSTGFLRATTPPVARERVFRSRLPHYGTYRAVALRSVARAHLSTAALIAAEPHIRSPFPERLAPQSLILKVIGLGRAGPHCISALSQPLFATVRPPGSNGADQARGGNSR